MEMPLKAKYRVKPSVKGVKKKSDGNRGNVGRRFRAAKRRSVCAKTPENSKVFAEQEIELLRRKGLLPTKNAETTPDSLVEALKALRDQDETPKPDQKVA